MARGIHTLVWAAVLLDSCPDVSVLSLRVEEGSQITIGPHYQRVIDIAVHADGPTDAVMLAGALGLGEDESARRVTEDRYGHGATAWRTWRGWVADGSREAPVCVQVTAGERVSVGAVA